MFYESGSNPGHDYDDKPVNFYPELKSVTPTACKGATSFTPDIHFMARLRTNYEAVL